MQLRSAKEEIREKAKQDPPIMLKHSPEENKIPVEASKEAFTPSTLIINKSMSDSIFKFNDDENVPPGNTTPPVSSASSSTVKIKRKFPQTEVTANSPLIPLDPLFIDEDTSRYLQTPELRKPYLVNFGPDGRLYDQDGKMLSNKYLMYVLDGENNLYGYDGKHKWNHSFFLAGAPVKGAGFIDINVDGDITLISNNSGHYKPTTKNMMPALNYFYEKTKASKIRDAIVYERHDCGKINEIEEWNLEMLVLNGKPHSKKNKTRGNTTRIHMENGKKENTNNDNISRTVSCPISNSGYDEMKIPCSASDPISRFALGPAKNL